MSFYQTTKAAQPLANPRARPTYTSIRGRLNALLKSLSHLFPRRWFTLSLAIISWAYLAFCLTHFAPPLLRDYPLPNSYAIILLLSSSALFTTFTLILNSTFHALVHTVSLIALLFLQLTHLNHLFIVILVIILNGLTLLHRLKPPQPPTS